MGRRLVKLEGFVEASFPQHSLYLSKLKILSYGWITIGGLAEAPQSRQSSFCDSCPSAE